MLGIDLITNNILYTSILRTGILFAGVRPSFVEWTKFFVLARIYSIAEDERKTEI